MMKAVLVVSFGTSYPETREKILMPLKETLPRPCQRQEFTVLGQVE